MTNGTNMLIDKAGFQKHQRRITLCVLGAYFFINGLINSTTVLMEAMRLPSMPFERWEPFVWEVSSALGSFLLVITLAHLLTRFPWDWQQPIKSLQCYALIGVIFCVAHVVFMIGSREVVYALVGKGYDFAIGAEQWLFELIYEFRKDIWSFIFFVVLIWGYRYVVSQWLGDATDIDIKSNTDNDKSIGLNTPSTQAPKIAKENQQQSDLLLIKKLGREFLVNKQDIEWIESSGNYLNLHIGDNVYPMRETFKLFLSKNSHLPLQRVHRSYAINVNLVDNIELTNSGDGAIKLTTGQTIKMSRRYKLSL